MLNKEIFIKRNIDPPSPLLRRVDKRFPHLLSSPRFHNNSLSWDFQHLSAPFTHSFLSFCLFVFCPADTKLCGTDTWASSKAVSSKCFTTEAYFFPCLFFPLSLPPPPPADAVISAPPVRTFSVFDLSAVIISSLSASLLESSVCKSDL